VVSTLGGFDSWNTHSYYTKTLKLHRRYLSNSFRSHGLDSLDTSLPCCQRIWSTNKRYYPFYFWKSCRDEKGAAASFVRFFWDGRRISAGDERGAQTRLDDILDGETRNAIANNNLVEIIRSTNRELEVSEALEEIKESEINLRIKLGRETLTRLIIEAASPRLQVLGIELLDLRFKRINYVEEVQKKIYERMITERKRIADKFRSEGQGEAAKILGNKERDLKKIQSEAYRTAQEIKGKADAEATAIYARTYNQCNESQAFYQFLKTMETYKNTLSEKDWLVLSTKGDFFKFLKNQSGE
jgi:HflC protein